MSHTPADDIDPTGIRALLASLPAPGPMPADVQARVEAALEHERHHPGDIDEGAHQPVIALGRAPVVSLVERRRPRWQMLGAAAATVAALSVSGALLVNGRRADQVSASLTPGAVKATTPVTLPSPNATQKVQIRASTRTYTSSDLTKQARTLLEPASGSTATGADIGPIGTPEGLAACIATLGEGDADSITADVAVFDGQPAVVIVAVNDGVQQVYVVPRECGKGGPALLREGTRLN